MWIFITAVSTALVFSFICSISESVLLSISHGQVESLARKGKKAGKLLRNFKRNIDVPIAAILIVNTIAHTIGASVAGATYQNVFDPSTLWIFTIVFTLAVLLFTEIIPKTLGVTFASQLAGPVARGIQIMTILLRPLVVVSEAISRRLRGNREVPVTSAEEIRLLAALGRNEGVVGVRTASMIIGATRLRQLSAEDVMVHRQSVITLSTEYSREEVLEVLKTSGHSRFPLTEGEGLDTVTGVVLAKELLYWMQENDSAAIPWQSLSRELVSVPDGQPLERLLRTFQESRRHLAIVVNEYGEAQGIVTLEDVIEEIVGEIIDEQDKPLEEFARGNDGSIECPGAAELRKIAAQLGINLSATDDVTTVGGLLSEHLRRVPRPGDEINWQGYRITVVRSGPRRVDRVRISPLSRE